MRKVELLPTRDCDAGYGPVYNYKYYFRLPMLANSNRNMEEPERKIWCEKFMFQ